ncbi:MAG: DUF2344 domain-containing protein [Candidatus Magnetobacterium sp. LHC-1]
MPLVYSKGFNPMPGISFGPALSVGVAGEREFFDIVRSGVLWPRPSCFLSPYRPCTNA